MAFRSLRGSLFQLGEAFFFSLPIYPNLAERYRVVSCLFLRAEVQLAFSCDGVPSISI
jgi:hypothetical protein